MVDQSMERCPSGRWCLTRNQVFRKGTWVRIPPSPPVNQRARLKKAGPLILIFPLYSHSMKIIVAVTICKVAQSPYADNQPPPGRTLARLNASLWRFSANIVKARTVSRQFAGSRVWITHCDRHRQAEAWTGTGTARLRPGQASQEATNRHSPHIDHHCAARPNTGSYMAAKLWRLAPSS